MEPNLEAVLVAIIAGHDYVHRYDVMLPKNRFKLDDVKGIKSLKGLGETEARKALQELEDIFFKEKAEPFMPFYHLIKEAI